MRTEGWAAGLYLAALSLRDRRDADELIAGFSGDDRRIVDYLVGEVLDDPAAGCGVEVSPVHQRARAILRSAV